MPSPTTPSDSPETSHAAYGHVFGYDCLSIGRAAGGENPFTASLVDDTAAKADIVFTTGSYVGSVVKTSITAGWSTRRGPLGNGLAVKCITAGYPKTVGHVA